MEAFGRHWHEQPPTEEYGINNVQNESNETGKAQQGSGNENDEIAITGNQGIELEGMSEESLSLIERLNRELAETGKLYAELSAEEETDRAEAKSGSAETAPEGASTACEAPQGEAPQAKPQPKTQEAPVAAEVEAEDGPAGLPWEGESESEQELGSNGSFMALIPEPLRAALAHKGYDTLTTVQQAVLYPETKGRDLQVSSQTGSGKTVALGILIAEGLIQAIESGASERPLALVITPTRELAAQVQKELNWLYAKARGLNVVVCTGGTSVGMERRNLERGPAIVVGTPGRLLDHISSGALKCEGIAQVVLDEADQMLDMGFREELEGILERTPKERSTHMVSATFPPGILKLAHRYQKNPVQVEGTRLGEANADIEHVAHLLFEPDRYAALVNLLLLTENERVLIFVNTRADTTDMAEALTKDGFSAMPLSGELVQAQRTRTLAAFRSGAVKVLVATDVAARGLDIPDVGLVIQAATPMDSEIYIHRSGRTGRAGQKGRCVLLVPARRERRLKRMLNDAGVDSNWCDIPTKEQVEKSLSKRARTRLFEAIDDEASLLEEDLAYAQKLVEERDPARVIATLLRFAKPESQCGAREIEPAQSFTRGWKHKERERMSAPNNQRTSSAGRSDSRASEFVRFNVTWGFREGANPQRLLAMVCRRGDITGRMVGSIDLGPTDSSFEVSASEADHFEQRALQSDPREPNVRITRGMGNAQPAGRLSTPQRGGYQGAGAGNRSQGGGYAGGGYQGRGGGDRSQGGGGYRGGGGQREGGYDRARSYGNRDAGPQGQDGGARGYGRGNGGSQRDAGGYGAGNQRQGGGYQGGGYQGRPQQGGYRSGDQRPGGGYQGGGYQGRPQQGGYQGGDQRSRGGYQGGGYQGRPQQGGYGGGAQRSGSYPGGGYRDDSQQGARQRPDGGGQRPGGYGDSAPREAAPKRGFQKRGSQADKRPYGRQTGYRSNSGDYSSGGGYGDRG